MNRGHLVWVAALSLVVGCTEGGSAGDQVVLAGRVFAADTGKPLSGSAVVAEGGSAAKTAADGSFELSYPSKQGGTVHVESEQGAPVSKAAPKKGGYVELHVKQYDVQQEIDASKGGAAEASNGARLAVKGDALTSSEGTSAKTAVLAVAAPDPTKTHALSSLPGDFDAKKESRAGKLSTRSPVYVSAKQGDQRLELKQGARASIDLPARGELKAVGETASLYQFDEAQGLWVERGTVEEVLNAAGVPVYRAEVEALGWWAVGEFYDELGCLHGCVRDGEGDPVASARVLATGVDYFGEMSVYTEADGCYTVEVRALSELLVSAQVEGAFAAPTAVSSGRPAQGSACVEVATLTLAAASDDGCPLGLVACGQRCVEPGVNTEACGGSDDAGGGNVGEDAGVIGGGDDAGMIGGGADAGVDGGPDTAAFFPLSVSLAGTGLGSVLSTPDGISCGDLCSQDFPAGSEVTLQAQAAVGGHTFAGWGGDCAGVEQTCTLIMDASRVVTASFAEPTGQLNVFPSDGSVSGFLDGGTVQVIDCDANLSGPDCSEVAPLGSLIDLIANPPANMTASWDGACVGQGLTCTVTVAPTTDVYVTFVPIQYTLTVQISGEPSPGPGLGSIALSPGTTCDYAASGTVTCPFTYDAGTVVTLTPQPQNLNYFGSWGGACAGVTSTDPCTLTIAGDTTVTGTFGYIIP